MGTYIVLGITLLIGRFFYDYFFFRTIARNENQKRKTKAFCTIIIREPNTVTNNRGIDRGIRHTSTFLESIVGSDYYGTPWHPVKRGPVLHMFLPSSTPSHGSGGSRSTACPGLSPGALAEGTPPPGCRWAGRAASKRCTASARTMTPPQARPPAEKQKIVFVHTGQRAGVGKVKDY